MLKTFNGCKFVFVLIVEMEWENFICTNIKKVAKHFYVILFLYGLKCFKLLFSKTTQNVLQKFHPLKRFISKRFYMNLVNPTI